MIFPLVFFFMSGGLGRSVRWGPALLFICLTGFVNLLCFCAIRYYANQLQSAVFLQSLIVDSDEDSEELTDEIGSDEEPPLYQIEVEDVEKTVAERMFQEDLKASADRGSIPSLPGVSDHRFSIQNQNES